MVNLQVGVKVDGKTIHINPHVLFSRLTLLVKREEDRTQCFTYSLTSESAALLKDGKMRVPDKATLRNNLLPLECRIKDPHSDASVIDGGDLLYKTS